MALIKVPAPETVAATKALAVGDIVAVQFRITSISKVDNALTLDAIVSAQSGFPGTVAIDPKDVVFVASE